MADSRDDGRESGETGGFVFGEERADGTDPIGVGPPPDWESDRTAGADAAEADRTSWRWPVAVALLGVALLAVLLAGSGYLPAIGGFDAVDGGVENLGGGVEDLADGEGDGVTRIDSCMTLDDPGRYVLASDLRPTGSGPCIEITASDVVLDGDGHAVTGPTPPIEAAGTDGVVAGSADRALEDVTVRDLTTVGWRNGTVFQRVRGGTLRNVTAREAGFNGIRLVDSHENVLRNVTLVDNDETGLPDRPGAGRGLTLKDSRRNRLSGLALVHNKYSLLLHGTSDNNTVEDVRSERAVYDVYLYAVDNTTVRNATSTGNRRYAIYTEQGARDTVVENFTVGSTTLSAEMTDVALRPVPSAAVESVPPPPDGWRSLDRQVEAYATHLPFSLTLELRYPSNASPSSLGAWRYGNGSWSRLDGRASRNALVTTVDGSTPGLEDATEFSSLGVLALLAEAGDGASDARSADRRAGARG